MRILKLLSAVFSPLVSIVRAVTMSKIEQEYAAALRDVLNDSTVVDEINAAIINCIAMITAGRNDEALLYAQTSLDAATKLRTKEAQESVMMTLQRLDDLLVVSGIVVPFEEAFCTMPGAEA